MTYYVKDLRKCVVNHKRIVALYQEGNAIIEISRITGYTRNTIKAHLRRAGVYVNPLDRKGNIYSRDFNSDLEGENESENGKNNLKEGHYFPPSDIEDCRNDFEKCQENREKNIGDVVVLRENRQIETGRETEIEEEEQEVIEAADTINLYNKERARDLALSNDQKQIGEIDKIINAILKLLKDKDRLKRSKTSVLNNMLSTMIEKKKLLQGLDPKNKGVDQVIVNFFMNRNFMEEIKKMKALKEKSV
jgi:hypothetical protein